MFIYLISESIRDLNPRTRSDQFENRTSMILDNQFNSTKQSSDFPNIDFEKDLTKDILIEEETIEEGKVSSFRSLKTIIKTAHSLCIFSCVSKNMSVCQELIL